MKISNLLKALLLAAIFSMLLTGCTSKITLHDSEKSQQEVELENYLPKDTVLTLSVNLNSQGQKEDFNALMAKFPQETTTKFVEGFVEELQLEFDALETNLEEDILPAFGENTRIILGMAIDPENTDGDPNMYLAATLEDPTKLTELLEKWIENDPRYTKSEQFNEVIYDNENDDFYLAIYKDTFLLTNKKQLRLEGLRRMKNSEESLLSNEMFKKAYEKLQQPYIANLYLNYENYFDLIASLDDTQVYPLMMKEGFDLSIIMAIYAENDGFKMVVLPAYTGKFNIEYHEPYLYNGIPGDNLLVYMESYGLKQAMEEAFDKMYEFDEETTKELRKAELLIKKTVGLDLREDILSFMDKGFAFAIQQNASMIPAMSIYVDASSNPESAQKVIDLLDAALQQAYEGMLEEAPSDLDTGRFLSKDVVEIGKSEIHKMSFDFSTMTEEELLAAGLPSGIFTEPIEIYYGLTVNNYLLISTYSGLDEDFGEVKTVGDNAEILAGREMFKDHPYNLSYVSVSETFEYIDVLFEAMEKVQGPMDEESREAYELVKAYFAPIKYMIGVDKVDESVGFVKID